MKYIDPKETKLDFSNPKFKITQNVKLKQSSYDKKCIIIVTGLGWAHGATKNVPYYEIKIECPNSQGQLEIYLTNETVLEKELK